MFINFAWLIPPLAVLWTLCVLASCRAYLLLAWKEVGMVETECHLLVPLWQDRDKLFRSRFLARIHGDFLFLCSANNENKHMWVPCPTSNKSARWCLLLSCFNLRWIPYVLAVILLIFCLRFYNSIVKHDFICHLVLFWGSVPFSSFSTTWLRVIVCSKTIYSLCVFDCFKDSLNTPICYKCLKYEPWNIRRYFM